MLHGYDMIPKSKQSIKTGPWRARIHLVKKKHREMLSIMYLHMGYYTVDDVHVFLYADCASMTCSK